MTTGTTALNFGAIGNVRNQAQIDIPEPLITANSSVGAWLRLESTAAHSIDELIMDPIEVFAGNIVPGVGFTIYGKMPYGGSYGLYKVDYATVI